MRGSDRGAHFTQVGARKLLTRRVEICANSHTQAHGGSPEKCSRQVYPNGSWPRMQYRKRAATCLAAVRFQRFGHFRGNPCKSFVGRRAPFWCSPCWVAVPRRAGTSSMRVRRTCRRPPCKFRLPQPRRSLRRCQRQRQRLPRGRWTSPGNRWRRCPPRLLPPGRQRLPSSWPRNPPDPQSQRQ